MKMKMLRPEEPEPKVPTDIRKAFAAIPSAGAAWKNLTPIARRDFISWIDSAKQSETHRHRIEKACSMLAAGRRRPCCYAIVPMNFYKALGNSPKAKAKWRELTSTERRDFIDWVESVKESDMRTRRIEKSCAMLAAGKRHP